MIVDLLWNDTVADENRRVENALLGGFPRTVFVIKVSVYL